MPLPWLDNLARMADWVFAWCTCTCLLYTVLINPALLYTIHSSVTCCRHNRLHTGKSDPGIITIVNSVKVGYNIYISCIATWHCPEASLMGDTYPVWSTIDEWDKPIWEHHWWVRHAQLGAPLMGIRHAQLWSPLMGETCPVMSTIDGWDMPSWEHHWWERQAHLGWPLMGKAHRVGSIIDG